MQRLLREIDNPHCAGVYAVRVCALYDIHIGILRCTSYTHTHITYTYTHERPII